MSKQSLEKELREPDMFVDFFGRVAQYLAARSQVVLWSFVALLLIMASSVFWFYFVGQKNSKASDALNDILKSYPTVYAETDYPSESWEALLNKLADFQKTYGSTPVNKTADLYRANIMMKLGKYEDAFKVYQGLGSKFPKPFAYIAWEGEAHALNEMKKWDESEKVWKKLSLAKDNPLREQHALSLGLTQEEKGAYADAIVTYQMFETEFPTSLILNEVRARLAIVKTK